jgi:multiple sugar transport system permease protein
MIKKKKLVSYSKWGYIFIAPFFIVYTIFSLIPLFKTFYYSFFELYTTQTLKQIGPNFVGFQNYITIFTEHDVIKYFGNTMLIWVIGFVPQILISLLLALIFTSYRMKIRGSRIFKTIVYMPNLIMASAFSMLFVLLFSDIGPINQVLLDLGIIKEQYRFLSTVWGNRGLIAGMNFLMWFGNTTILLMAGIMGVDQTLFEAAEVDGANSFQIFKKVTLPLIFPIVIYVIITSLIGGIQMFDIPEILTDGGGGPRSTSLTIIMFLNMNLKSRNFGIAGATSIILFIITAILSLIIFKILVKPYSSKRKNFKEAKK